MSPSDQDVGNSPYRPLAVLSDVRVGSNPDMADMNRLKKAPAYWGEPDWARTYYYGRL